MTITQVLQWVLNSGGAALILAFVLERIPAYKTITDPETKRWIFFGGSFAISALAFAILTYAPADILTQIAPWFALLYVSFTTYFTGTAGHALDKNVSEPKG